MFDAALHYHVNTLSNDRVKVPTNENIEPVLLGVAGKNHPLREEVENFIQAGFKRAHSAEIHSFLPNLFYLKFGKIKTALGVRSAKETLFLEQYLPSQHNPSTLPNVAAKSELELALQEKGIVAARHQIVEIGNLHSTSSRFTQQLLLCTVLTLALCDKTHIAFTGVPNVIRIFDKFGIPLTALCQASETAVKSGPDKWGNYYKENPQVMVLDIADAVNAIEQTPALKSLRHTLSLQIFANHQQLKEVLA
ncbi:thermostable hemolysin [Alteromonas sp. a30]|uniref:thermostable hemolysin n=1 Tax=Alteromonas sp. a30 TaxID=2730917 RepID=UPI00227FE634|nr:thermostable hemolysin [Alteromonas sp. a30]MCY7295539.1 hypothetical protein [Alteromonas sp. a30]